MDTKIIYFSLVLTLFCTSLIAADTWYVDASRPDDTGPGTEWANAFQTIQAAVDAAEAGDTVLVANGLYNAGGQTFGAETMTNRVSIWKAVHVIAVSTNPADTIIKGAPDPGTGGPGPAAVRGVYMVANATLSGFTVTNGHTQASGAILGGGIYAVDTTAIVSNCVIIGNIAYRNGGGLFNATVYDSVIMGNSTIPVNSNHRGGGARGSILYRCLIEGNSAIRGGGLYRATAFECEFYRNSGSYGGAANESEVYDSIIQYHTGGSYGTVGSNSEFYRCEISRNIGSTALARGGYFESCVIKHNTNTSNAGMTTHTQTYLVNCLIVSNVAGSTAGTPLFANLTTLVNCTIVFNRSNQGGIISSAHTSTGVTNCIVYYNNYNRNGNYSATSLDFRLADANLINVAYSCTPILDNLTGPGNITNEPMFLIEEPAPFMLLRLSPCVDAGTAVLNPLTGLAITNDIAGVERPLDGTGDGEALYDIGAYEYILPPKGILFFAH